MELSLEKSWSALSYLAVLQVLMVATSLSHESLALNLSGSGDTYVEYPPWDMCLNGSISLEFKTLKQHGLLLYLHRTDMLHFALKLMNGNLQLRADFGLGHIQIYTAQVLNDGEWHSVQVAQDGDVTSLNIDGIVYKKPSPRSVSRSESSDQDLPSSPHSSSSSSLSSSSSPPAASPNASFLYAGGLPQEYKSKYTKILAQPFIAFEPKFQGSLRNLFYQNCSDEPQRPEILSSSGILTSDIDLCEQKNPCLNAGRCLTTDNGRICDCESTDFTGDRCDIQKNPSDATFLGAQYISYNLSSKGGVMNSRRDVIMLDFRTKQPDCLLFYIGNSKDFITIGLDKGVMFVNVNLGSGVTKITPTQERFTDNRWHQLRIKRESSQVKIEVDGMYKSQHSTTGEFVSLSSNVLYVAGSPNTEHLAGSQVSTNFKGCMRKVRYEADNIRIDLTALARQQHSLLTLVGDVLFDKCHELAESHPITFATPGAYITVPTWDRSRSKGSLAFQFRTVEQGGLMMYSNGNRDSHDFFALEIMDGQLYLVLDMGSGIQKVKATHTSISDGEPHNVFFEFYDNKGSISVDDRKAQFSTPRVSDRFDLHGKLYVGGVPPTIDLSELPRELWTAMFGLFYVGCLQDLVVNGNMVDLVAAAKVHNESGVVDYCRQMEPQCPSQPCIHHGKCVEGWNRFTCDCRATGYTGNVCQSASVTLRFDGSQYLRVSLPHEDSTQAEDISLRFRTMHGSGMLFVASGQNGDGFELYLERGALFLSVIVGSGAKVLSAGRALGDDRWHTVIIRRRLNVVEVAIDTDRPVADQIPGNTFTMTTSKILVGLTSTPQRDVFIPHSRRHVSERSLAPRPLMLRDENTPERYSGFIGSMQSFIFNGKDFFQMASLGHANIETSAHVSTDEYVVREPVTFKSVDAWAVLPLLRAHEEFSISLQFKTTESNGLIVYNGGKGDDFFAIELYQGFLYYVYNMGEGPQRVRANVIQPLNDNKWHEVGLLRNELEKQQLRVDDNTPTIDDLTGARNNRFDLDGKMYLGGVRKTMYPSLPKLIYSRHGFVGCLGSLDLNGYTPNVLREAHPVHESVGDGCRGPVSKCVNDSCANFGRCVQRWNSYRCDCDMTSYTGPKCTAESVSYKFGPRPGLITFTYPPGKQPSTNFESLAFGLQTFQNNSIILSIDSVNYGDFIRVELHNGCIYIIYNMGNFNHPLGNFYQKVNDGRYHVVRFTRAGPNATLQVDAEMPLEKNPTGIQSHTFNYQAYIKIGGNKTANNTITKPFEGIISGLVLNGVRLFELAKERDPRIQLEGSVALHRKPVESDLYTDDEDLGEMQSTQPQRQKRMSPALSRHQKQRAGKMRSHQNTVVSQADAPLSARHRDKASSGWRRASVLEPNRERYETYIHPDGHEVVRRDYPTQYTGAGGDAEDNFSSVYRGDPYSRQPTWYDQTRHDPDYSDWQGHKSYSHVKQKHKPAVSKASPVGHQPECHYEVIARAKPKAAALVSEAHHSGLEMAEPQWGNGYKELNTDSSGRGESYSQILETYPSQSHPDHPFEIDEKEKQDEDNDDGEGIFKVSHQEENFRSLDGIDNTRDPGDVAKSDKYAEVYEALASFNNILQNFPQGETDVSDSKESSTESTVTPLRSNLDDRDDSDDLSEAGSGDGTVGETENSNSWVKYSYRPMQSNLSRTSAQYRDGFQRSETTTIVLPYQLASHMRKDTSDGAPATARVVLTGVEMEGAYARLHTTTREGVTEDIIFAGSGCHYENPEDCSVIGSGTDEEIITAVVVVTSTTTPKPSSTERPKQPCHGPDCGSSSKLRLTPDGVEPGSTRSPNGGHGSGSGSEVNGHSYDVDGQHGGGNGGYNGQHSISDYDEDSTAEPGKQTDKGGSGINLGLILGVLGSVLLAVIVLAIAFCKLRSRDEGTYKVDETQNFSALQSKKTQGNGAMASGGESGGGKRGKKKDVKEWYV